MNTYELKSLNMPVLSGAGLQIFAALLELNITRSLLAPQLMKNAGITKLREQLIDEAPTYYPTPGTKKITDQKIKDKSEYLSEALFNYEKTELPFQTIRDYAKAYRTGITTPLTVAEEFLKKQQESDSGEFPLRAFIALSSEDLLNQAKASTERLKNGKPLSILDGVPIAVKDELDQAPFPTTAGTAILGKEAAKEDATVVLKLRNLGALLVGKTSMHEIGINPTGYNRNYGITRNPYDRNRDSGGSSSGSAAAVASGLCPASIGADGGGSIRIPASLCGLAGLKATFSRISEHGAAPLCWSVGHVGPIACCVEDLAVLYAAIAGPDPKNPITLQQPETTFPELSGFSPVNLSVGYYPQWFEHADEEVVNICKEALSLLTNRGARLETIEIENLDEMRIAHAITILSEMHGSMLALKADTAKFAGPVRVNLSLAGAITNFDFLQAQRMRTKAIKIWDRIFDSLDLIATPTSAIPAPVIPDGIEKTGISDINTVTELMRFAFPGNLTGHPSVTVPVGYTKNGLPVGLQLTANYWREDLLLQVAYFLEKSVKHKLPEKYYKLF